MPAEVARRRRSRRAAAISILLSLLAAPVWAGFDEATAAYKRGDYQPALRELQPLVNQGHAKAQNTLGLIYGHGDGVPRDLVRAHMWFNLNASSLPAGPNRHQAVKNRDLVAKLMTPAQIAEAERLAREWMAKHNR